MKKNDCRGSQAQAGPGPAFPLRPWAWIHQLPSLHPHSSPGPGTPFILTSPQKDDHHSASTSETPVQRQHGFKFQRKEVSLKALWSESLLPSTEPPVRTMPDNPRHLMPCPLSPAAAPSLALNIVTEEHDLGPRSPWGPQKSWLFLNM